MEMSRSEGKRTRIQMTRHNEGIPEAGAGTGVPQNPPSGERLGVCEYSNWLKLWYLTAPPR